MRATLTTLLCLAVLGCGEECDFDAHKAEQLTGESQDCGHIPVDGDPAEGRTCAVAAFRAGTPYHLQRDEIRATESLEIREVQIRRPDGEQRTLLHSFDGANGVERLDLYRHDTCRVATDDEGEHVFCEDTTRIAVLCAPDL